MANKLIQDLTATAAVLTTDLFEKQPIAGPPSEKATISQLVTLLDTIYAPITGGAYVLKAGDTMTGLLTIAQATANTSNLILSGQSLTGANAQSLLDMVGTWNTSGVPTALKLNITNTASGSLSMLMDLQIGGVSQFSVEKDGDVRSSGQGFFASAMYGTQVYAGWNGTQAFAGLNAPSNGVMTLIPWSGTDFRLQFAGTTSAFPALRRNANGLEVRLADDSGNGLFSAFQITADAAVIAGAGSGFVFGSSRGRTIASADGVFVMQNDAATGFTSLVFGGMTTSFPSLKRSTTTLQARLADDSAFANFSVLNVLSNLAASFITSSVALTDSAAAALATLTNAPTAGNPTKWIGINDNGTIRQIPCW